MRFLKLAVERNELKQRNRELNVEVAKVRAEMHCQLRDRDDEYKRMEAEKQELQRLLGEAKRVLDLKESLEAEGVGDVESEAKQQRLIEEHRAIMEKAVKLMAPPPEPENPNPLAMTTGLDGDSRARTGRVASPLAFNKERASTARGANPLDSTQDLFGTISRRQRPRRPGDHRSLSPSYPGQLSSTTRF